jgi:hypothetical protein
VNAESKFDEIVKKKKGGRPRKVPKPAEAAAPETPSTPAAAAPAEAAPSSPPAEPPGREMTPEEKAARDRRNADLKRFL